MIRRGLVSHSRARLKTITISSTNRSRYGQSRCTTVATLWSTFDEISVLSPRAFNAGTLKAEGCAAQPSRMDLAVLSSDSNYFINFE